MGHNDNNKTKLLTLTALLAALTCAATLLIQIPTPTKGYVNLGDCLVNISAWILGPVYGAAAAGIGSAMADLISGYVVFVPATLVIKALMAVAAWYVYKALSRRAGSFPARTAAAVVSELIMAVGYSLFDSVLAGSFTAAVIGIPGDLVQGGLGVVTSVAIYELVIKRIPKAIK
ncbi:MAG: ECF transporter S component [Ruminococcus sp.]|nr:ECF transporter S component [Ruminococcus sp.]